MAEWEEDDSGLFAASSFSAEFPPNDNQNRTPVPLFPPASEFDLQAFDTNNHWDSTTSTVATDGWDADAQAMAMAMASWNASEIVQAAATSVVSKQKQKQAQQRKADHKQQAKHTKDIDYLAKLQRKLQKLQTAKTEKLQNPKQQLKEVEEVTRITIEQAIRKGRWQPPESDYSFDRGDTVMLLQLGDVGMDMGMALVGTAPEVNSGAEDENENDDGERPELIARGNSSAGNDKGICCLPCVHCVVVCVRWRKSIQWWWWQNAHVYSFT